MAEDRCKWTMNTKRNVGERESATGGDREKVAGKSDLNCASATVRRWASGEL